MAIKKVLQYGDDILRQKSKEVTKVSRKIQILCEDLLDTMYAQNGVGLAAPQIGVSLRVFVIDVSNGSNEKLNPMVFINPKIIKKSGAVNSYEGCLSFPKAYTYVRRYKDVVVKALNQKGKSFVLEAKEGELLARAIQHEFDHLDGILFIDHCRNRFEADSILKENNLPPICVEKLIKEDELENEIQKQQAKKENQNEEKK